jgi:adenylate kinase
VLDGFPRTIPQAEALDEALAKLGTSIDKAINVHVPDENIVSRMSGRRSCPACGSVYHVEQMPPKKDGICDSCGAKLVQRDDDKPETVKKRLKVYHEQTQPLIDYYENKGILKTVDGTASPDDVFNAIEKAL